MIITYHNKETFKITQGDLTVAINPQTKGGHRFGSDVVFVTTNHADMNGIDAVTRGDKVPFAITGPGEYEVKGVTVKGFHTPSDYDKTQFNTVYFATIEGIKMCFLGTIGGIELGSEIPDQLDDLDILFVPINGAPSNAAKLTVKCAPKLIIPMLYTDKDLKTFLKEVGSEGNKAQPKLTLKAKDLTGEGEVAVLSAQ